MSFEKSPPEKLVHLIDIFTANTLTGQLSGLWKQLFKKNIPNEKIATEIKTDYINFLKMSLVHYMNLCCRSLILQNDQYVINAFSEMREVMHHGYRCLLNIVFARIIFLISELPSFINVIQFDKTQWRLINSIEIMKDVLNKSNQPLIQSISHTCSSYEEDITKWDPKKDMFHISFRTE